ncbi:hypothetical protein CCACVL1_02706 [Corchorus capsularis]|uniref:Uncharacterized protein n=1 Tax=Corchorus capsularis TaxID=210143 RepID=A0A1R3K6S4_COCAP|nr:hypothetical protein CCACVL1_02706 [Corchorus capsularis]
MALPPFTAMTMAVVLVFLFDSIRLNVDKNDEREGLF